MATITAAQTHRRPASTALEVGLAGNDIDPDLAQMAAEQQRLREQTSSLVARMNDPLIDADELDRLTLDVTRVLVLAEDLRQTRAKAVARSSGDVRRWRERLAID